MRLHPCGALHWARMQAVCFATVAKRLSMGPMIVEARWVKTMWELFIDTGDVQSHQGERTAPPTNLIMDELASWQLINQLLDKPEYTLNEHHAEFQLETATSVGLVSRGVPE